MISKLSIKISNSNRLIATRALEYHLNKKAADLGLDKLPTLGMSFLDLNKQEREYIRLEVFTNSVLKALKSKTFKLTLLYADSFLGILIFAYNNKVISKESLHDIAKSIGESFTKYSEGRSKSFYSQYSSLLNNLHAILIEY